MDREIVTDVREGLAILMKAVDPGRSFYSILFRRLPQLRGMFPVDMERQEKKFLSALRLIADGCDNLELLRIKLVDLGGAHIAHGVGQEHYRVVREILVELMSEQVGDRYAKSWDVAFGWACEVMASVTVIESE